MTQLMIIMLGFIFGLLISYGQLNKFNTIAGLSVLKNFTVAKTIMLVLGIGGILLLFELRSGEAVFHVKPLFVVGTALGGIIFGIGMSILGYCPGTLPISLGQGALDAFVGIVGGVVGGIVYTLLYPTLLPLLGENLGKVSLFTLMGGSYSIGYMVVVFIISLAMIAGAFWLHKLDVRNGLTSNKWIVTGVGLAFLNLVLFYKGWQNQPLGASSSYPYVGDNLVDLNTPSYAYYATVVSSGKWQIWFLLGALLAGFVYAVSTKTFHLRFTQSLWREYKGDSFVKRLIWALVGGFLLIFGARMADGCTSGHIISGGMQFAISSYLFAICTFIGFLTTGYLFYTRRK